MLSQFVRVFYALAQPPRPALEAAAAPMPPSPQRPPRPPPAWVRAASPPSTRAGGRRSNAYAGDANADLEGGEAATDYKEHVRYR